MARFFINRPIVAMVLSIIVVLLGVAMQRLPVAQHPEIVPMEVVHTLLEAVVLVVIVVFVFLQNWRATLIPLMTVPVSLVGAFMFFPLLGFSINVLSLVHHRFDHDDRIVDDDADGENEAQHRNARDVHRRMRTCRYGLSPPTGRHAATVSLRGDVRSRIAG